MFIRISHFRILDLSARQHKSTEITLCSNKTLTNVETKSQLNNT